MSPDWNSYENARYNPCGTKAADGDLVLASTSQFIDTEEVGEGVRAGPLPAQNDAYVHYLTQYNKESFKHVVEVLQGKATKDSEFPDGSVNVKSAWVEMKKSDRERFYVRKAWVRKFGGGCRKTDVGLVGLHIVQKTPSRPHWIWSTFEQIDNAPVADGKCPPPGGPYTSFDSKNCQDMPKKAPKENTPHAPPRVIFNVQRASHPINLRTHDTNSKYQGQFSHDSRWKNYELVMTQWPTQNVAPQQAGDPRYTFPDASIPSAFANTVIETFFQNDIKLSRMGCHAEVGSTSDFMWSLQIEPSTSRSGALTQLRKTLADAGFLLQ